MFYTLYSTILPKRMPLVKLSTSLCQIPLWHGKASAHTFCKVKLKHKHISHHCRQTDSPGIDPVLQEEGQRIGTACSGFLGPQLRRRRQPVRSLHHHLLPDWKQPPDQFLLDASHTVPAGANSLNTAEKEIRAKGNDIQKGKLGARPKGNMKHITDNKGGSVCMYVCVRSVTLCRCEGISFHAGMNGRKPKHPLHVIEFPSVCSVVWCILW